MRKQERHRIITQLLSEHDVKKQEDFVAILAQQGVTVTQATISRDIKEMKLIKVPAQNGGYRYSVPQKEQEDVNEKLADLLKEAVVSVDQMEKFISVKTLPGNASACANLLEKQFAKNLFATVNDDDSVLMIARTEEEAKQIQQEIAAKSQNN
ncbi:ArgR family transcriptional regulator [Enterococcus pseudoavium]|uniref:Arginine repressor n=1 Tax=Enterococcus pseudoavium TaxID=44007 RepID=A0AAE4I295_9ENTE|nr:ArgR family transcriptional regulator [Enterococcus pseudoavium]MDT2737137.1 ArgR family transcriptional regulator [Enterococcus pseudoavium]REC32142.1 ArgR family transcriptional regulator [Enterococcus pseudoavium]